MSAPAKNAATTPIPVQLSETEFNEFIFSHLSMPKRGPRCKIGYHRLFNLILWVLYTGMCIFHGNPATDSTAKLPSVPHESCH